MPFAVDGGGRVVTRRDDHHPAIRTGLDDQGLAKAGAEVVHIPPSACWRSETPTVLAGRHGLRLAASGEGHIHRVVAPAALAQTAHQDSVPVGVPVAPRRRCC